MYDKAISIVIKTEVAEHFSVTDLKKYAKIQIVNALIGEGLTVDKNTQYEYRVVRGQDVTVSVRARRE